MKTHYQVDESQSHQKIDYQVDTYYLATTRVTQNLDGVTDQTSKQYSTDVDESTGTATVTYYSKSNSGKQTEFYESGTLTKTVDHKDEWVHDYTINDSYDPTSTQGSKSGSVTYDWTETVTENGSATTTGDNWADNEEVGNGSYSSNSSGGVFHWQAYFQHYQDQRPGQILAQPPKPNASAPATADSGPQQTWSQWAGQGISDAGDWIYDNASFLGHTALDIVGLFPVLGNAADLVNAAWYSWEGDYTNAALSTASAAIGVGIGVTLVKYGKIILDAAPLNAVKNVTDTIGTFVGDTLTGAQKLLADQSGAIDVTALYDGMEWVGAKFTGWGPFGRGIAPKGLPALTNDAKDALRASARDIWQARTGRRAVWDGMDVHHRIPLEWSHLFPNADANRVANLIGMKSADHTLVTNAWNAWRQGLNGRIPTQAEVLQQALRIDEQFGKLMTFLP